MDLDDDKGLHVQSLLYLNEPTISTTLLTLLTVKPPIHFHYVLHAKKGGGGPDSV